MAAEFSSTSEPSEGSLIGSLISLTSNNGIRYEGIIYYLNPEESSICLRNVRSFGTEGRKKDCPQVPPSDKVHGFVIFRGSDIEDVQVKSLPSVQTAPVHYDTDIIQSHYSPMGPASTPRSGTISDRSSQAAQLGHPSSTFEGGLPLYQAGKNIESLGSAPPVANCSGFGTPMYWQGFSAPMSGFSHLPQTPLLCAAPRLSIPHSLPQHAQFSTTNSLFPYGTLSLHEAASRLPPLINSTSTLVSTSVQHPNINSLFAATPFPQFFSPLSPPASCLPSLITTSLPATVAPTHTNLLAAEPSLNLLPNRCLVNSHPASVFGLNINAPGASVPENNTSISSTPSYESSPSLPFQKISQSMPSSSSSFSSIQSETSLNSVTPGQLQHPIYSMFPSSLPVQTIHEDAKFKAQEIKIKSESIPLTYERPPPATSMKEPLLPLPKYPSYSMLSSSLPVQTIHEDAKFKAQEPKIKSESVPLTSELPPPATSMMEPLLPLPKYPSYSMLSSSLPVQTIHEDAKFKAQEPKIKSESVPLTSELPPLLPLPKLAQKWRNEAASCYYHHRRSHGRRGWISFSKPTRFTEDFDFEAMNQKFNKAEVWGHLGKGKALEEYDKSKEQSSNMNAIREEDEESVNLESQPVYSKDDFFDKLSDKREPSRDSGRASISEQLKVDMETPSRHRSKRGGSRGSRGCHGGRWHGSNYERGNSSNTRGRGHGFPD